MLKKYKYRSKLPSNLNKASRFLLLTVAPLLWSTTAGGQIPFFSQVEQNEVLLSSAPQLLYECSDGYIWMGAQNGLFRYDGSEALHLAAPHSEKNEEVSALYQDKKGRLWVGYASGQICYSDNLQTLNNWTPEEGLPVVPITGFGEDGRGNFWFSTYGEGIYVMHQERIYNFNMDDGLLGDDIYEVVFTNSGEVLLATDGGINVCSIQDRRKLVRAIIPEDGLPDEIVRTFIPDKEGRVWIGTYDEGFCYLNLQTGQIKAPIPDWSYGTISSLEIFEGKELWIGTEREGLFRYQLESGDLLHLPQMKDQNWGKITDLHKDVEGNLWVLSSGPGISKTHRPFEFVRQNLKNIQAIYSDHKDQIWVGTQSGLFVMKKNEHSSTYFEPVLPALELNVLSLYEDQYHNLWIGTFGSGIYCYHPASGALRHLNEADGLTNGSVLSIDGTKEQVWMATLGGVTEYEAKDNIMTYVGPAFTNYNTASGLGTNFIYKIFIDQRGRTWFGTDGKGLSVLEDGQLTHYPRADSIQLNSVYSITEDHQGHLWFSTAKEGIFEFDGRQFHRLSLKEGIRNLAITSLATDAHGNILIVHPSGIDILNPQTKHLIYYDDEVGITDFSPNLNAVCKDNSGEIWLAGQKKVIKYTLLEESLSIHPRTHITQVSVFLDPVDFRSKNRFRHHENNMVFEFVGLWYTDPEIVRYRYQLEGFDQGWINTKDRQATYSNLPPGRYTFKVSSTENDAFDQEPIVDYAFTIVPPIWRRPWFVIGMGALGIALLSYIVKIREKRLSRESSLKKEKIESQYEALKSQINPHFLFNSFNTLITIIEENPESGVRYVEKLSDLYRSILQYREKETISLEEELVLVKNYFYILSERYGEKLRLYISLPDRTGHEVAPLSLQILMENAIKHNVISSEKPLTVHIRQSESYLEISNNIQEKRTQEPSTGFGLDSIISRYSMLTSRPVEIIRREGIFTVRLPLIKNTTQ